MVSCYQYFIENWIGANLDMEIVPFLCMKTNALPKKGWNNAFIKKDATFPLSAPNDGNTFKLTDLYKQLK